MKVIIFLVRGRFEGTALFELGVCLLSDVTQEKCLKMYFYPVPCSFSFDLQFGSWLRLEAKADLNPGNEPLSEDVSLRDVKAEPVV